MDADSHRVTFLGRPGVFTAHDTLQIGKFTDHITFKVSFAEPGGAADIRQLLGADFISNKFCQTFKTLNFLK